MGMLSKSMIVRNNFAIFTIVGGITILGTTALIVVSGGRFDSNWTKDGGTLIIEGKPLPNKTQ